MVCSPGRAGLSCDGVAHRGSDVHFSRDRHSHHGSTSSGEPSVNEVLPVSSQDMADAAPQRPSKERVDYALKYEAARTARNAQHKGIVLPLEFLVSRSTGEPFLSVSLSGTGEQPL